MQNNIFKFILIFYFLAVIIMSITGVLIAHKAVVGKDVIFSTIMGAIIILSIICMIFALFIMRKVTNSMSKMLQSSNPYSLDELEEDEENLDDAEMKEIIRKLRISLRKANTEKRQNDIILNQMTDGVISFDISGNVIYMNPAAKTLLELKGTEKNFHDIFGEFKNINMERIIYLDDLASPEAQISNNHGTMKLFFKPFKDEIDRPIGLLAMIQDITEHVRLDNMRKEFIADVSHELKTPLTSIKGFSETLLESDVDEKTRNHFLKIIDDNANRMEKLVKDLLILSKIDGRKENVIKTEFDLGELVKSASEKFEIEVKKKKQKLECLVTADVPKVYANKDGIERVVLNIISNSVKYTNPGGKINVYVGFVHNDAYVKIKDNGIGIPEKDLNKVFDRFYRVDKDRARQSGGTGLGLSIAKEIMEQNDGSIDIKSKLNKGTEVILKIPIKKEENE